MSTRQSKPAPKSPSGQMEAGDSAARKVAKKREKRTITEIRELKRTGEKMVYMSVRDYTSAKWAEMAGVDVAVVGDRVAMVAHGHPNTIPASMDMMIMHGQAVRRGAPDTFSLGSPYQSYHSVDRALMNATRFMQELLCDAVKPQGGKSQAHILKASADAGIPTASHIGLTPHTIAMFGGLKIQGRTAQAAMTVPGHARVRPDAAAHRRHGARLHERPRRSGEDPGRASHADAVADHDRGVDGLAPAPKGTAITDLFSFGELDAAWSSVSDLASENIPRSDVDGSGQVAAAPTRRMVSQARTLYRKDDLTGLCRPDQLESLALPGDTFTLALTPALVGRVLGRAPPTRCCKATAATPTSRHRTCRRPRLTPTGGSRRAACSTRPATPICRCRSSPKRARTSICRAGRWRPSAGSAGFRTRTTCSPHRPSTPSATR